MRKSFPIDKIHKGERFEFGENWLGYLKEINSERILVAEKSLLEMFEMERFDNLTFLDAGCGSGLFSLAARNLGAKVFSFDYDPKSAQCASALKNRYYREDSNWQIEEGSVLDLGYLEKIGTYDLVYCWGVIHHTGQLMKGLENITVTVKSDGKIFVALYNDQGIASKYWRVVKQCYVRYTFTRPILIFVHLLYPVLPSLVLKRLRKEKIPRGMSAWHDFLDWLGGYPFETSTVNEVFSFFKTKGFRLQNLKTVGGKMGCNEFLFGKKF